MKNYYFILLSILLMGCEDKTKQKTTDFSQLSTYSKEGNLQAVVEIPAGTNQKMQYNPETQKFETDSINAKKQRINFLPFLGNYGFIPSTDSEKGALDIFIIAESVPTGTVTQVIPIGMMRLVDKEQLRNIIIAVPADEAARIITAKNFDEFSEDYPEIRKMIGNWFMNFESEDEVYVRSWGGENSAIQEIENRIKR